MYEQRAGTYEKNYDPQQAKSTTGIGVLSSSINRIRTFVWMSAIVTTRGSGLKAEMKAESCQPRLCSMGALWKN